MNDKMHMKIIHVKKKKKKKKININILLNHV